jgi:hypothetical protein
MLTDQTARDAVRRVMRTAVVSELMLSSVRATGAKLFDERNQVHAGNFLILLPTVLPHGILENLYNPKSYRAYSYAQPSRQNKLRNDVQLS